MRLPYVVEPIVPGKWYLTELPSFHRRMPGDSIETNCYGAGSRRLSSGFDSKDDAIEAERELVKQHPEYRGRIYIWRADT